MTRIFVLTASAVFGLLIATPAPVAAQTLGRIPILSDSAQRSTAAVPNKAVCPKKPKGGTKTAGCGWGPLFRAGDDEIEAFYGTNRLALVNQVDFLYGIGAGRKTVKTELASLLFPAGVRLALAATAAAEPAGTTPEESDLDQLRSGGGDVALRAMIPLFATKKPRGQAYLLFSPELNTIVSGLAAAQSSTGSTEVAADFAAEGYAEWSAIGDTGALFISGRAGRQYFTSGMQQALGLKGGSHGAYRVAVGVAFGNLRVSLQRSSRPRRTAESADSLLDRWVLGLQLGAK